ncbi:MAG: RDD family protein [Dehalococcoidia bacterium]
MAEPEREYASFFRRLGALVIDEITKSLVYLGILIMIAMLTGNLPDAPADPFDPAALAPRLLLSFGYDWIFWSQGWTPGASLMGIRIVRPDGAPPGAVRGAVRALIAIPSAGLFFLGYAWMLLSPRKQTWHDLAAGVYVVRVHDRDTSAR